MLEVINDGKVEYAIMIKPQLFFLGRRDVSAWVDRYLPIEPCYC